MEENVRQLIEYAENQRILAFDRAFCDLPLISNPSPQKESCEETALLRGLNTRSGLFFSGVKDERCHVDAITEIHSEKENEKAKSIQSRLGSGCFYTSPTQRFFVIHDINVRVSETQNLPRRIHEAYC